MKNEMKKIKLSRLVHLKNEVKKSIPFKLPAGVKWGTWSGDLSCSGYPQTSCTSYRV